MSPSPPARRQRLGKRIKPLRCPKCGATEKTVKGEWVICSGCNARRTVAEAWEHARSYWKRYKIYLPRVED
jgi:hypothetical protein